MRLVPARSPKTLPVIVLILVSFGCSKLSTFTSKEDFLKRGMEFAQQGKLEDAALQYRKALQKDDKYGEAYLRFGQLLVKQEKPLEAFAAFSRATELMPASTEASMELGRTALPLLLASPRRPQNMYQAVEKSTAALLAKDPNSLEGLRLRGYLQIADSKPKEAIETFRKSLAIQPNQPEIYTVLVQTLIVDNQGAEAENVAKKGIEVSKNYGPLYDTLYGYYLSNKRSPDGEQVLQQKIANNPKQVFFQSQLADHYWSQKQPQKAEEILSHMLSRPQEFPAGPLEAGDFYRRVGKLEQAATLYAKGLQSDPDRKKEYRDRLVTVELERGRIAEATALLDVILKESPDDAEALGARASLRMASGKPQEMKQAVAEFTSLVQKKPESLPLRLNLARAYRQTGQINEARASLQEILRRSPQNREALREMADLSIRNQQPDEALQYADRLLALDPNNVGARLARTSALALRGRNNEVRADLRRLTAENPNLAEPWLQLAVLNTQEGKYGEAESILNRLYRPGQTDTRALAALVNLNLARKQPQKALALVQEEAQRSKDPAIKDLLASTAASAGNIDLALSTLVQLASEFPDNSDFLVRIGRLSQQKGQADQAIASLKKATTVAPSDPLPYAHLSAALAQAGRHTEAVQAARESVKLQPEEPLFQNNLAWNLALAGTNLEEALSLSQKALQKSPKNSDFNDTLGMVYLKSKKADNALTIFQSLVRNAPDNPVYRMHLAMTFLDLGQKAKANSELETALKSNPSATDAEQIRRLQASAR